MQVFYVESRMKTDAIANRHNGKLGPFKSRDTAERALIALCQAGQATSGEITTGTVPDDQPHASA